MEQEELELITRLKHTKQMEEAAHQDLEVALHADPEAQLVQQPKKAGGRGKGGARGGKR